MTVSHKVSFQAGAAFEQHSAEFTLSSSDLTQPSFNELSLSDKMRVMNSIVLVQGLFFMLSEGYISSEDFGKRANRIKSLLPDRIRFEFISVFLDEK